MAKNDEIECGEGGGEEKVAHELRLDSEARRVREAERAIGATGAEESGVTREADGIHDALYVAK